MRANWSDNPWFPGTLDEERLTDLKYYPDRYEHIWEGGYVKALDGAYFSKELAAAKAEGRICKLRPDPLLPIRAFWDLGGSGANADALAIWIVQFVGREIWVLDYIEGQAQVLSYYVNELRKRGWADGEHGNALCTLPHDGIVSNSISGKRYEDHLRDAEFQVETIPNQGQGAAMMRIEAARRLFSRIVFNDDTTEPGRDALGYYHEKRDQTRQIGLGPDHDWSSHAADAFGLMCICYETPKVGSRRAGEGAQSRSPSSWMGV